MKSPKGHSVIKYSIILGFVWVSASWAKASEKTIEAGESQLNKGDYIEYISGNLPVIISAPHGGRLKPDNIADRTKGVLQADANTDLLAKDIAQAFHQQTGKYPHVIICHLKRLKLDCNRDLKEAAQGDKEAERVWNDFHSFIEQARNSVIEMNGEGLYIDLHGHGHPELRLELGYLLSNRQLKKDTKELEELEGESSIRILSQNSEASFVEFLRGDSSFGGLMQKRGFPSVPSPKYPHAGEAKYFNGGYNTRRYGSLNGGGISGFQVECPRKSVRDTDKNRKAFAKSFAGAVVEYLRIHKVWK